jgi:hypothetical protein
MNKTNMPEPDLDNLLKQTLKDDLPPAAEDKMNRQFLSFKRSLDQIERLPAPNRHLWMHEIFRKEILAVISAAMIILGLGMQLQSPQSALAHSIERLKVFVPISASLNRASSMDGTMLKRDEAGEQLSYHIRWTASGDVRVDMNTANYTQTLWISKKTVSITSPDGSAVSSMPLNEMTPGSVWQPAMEFLSPTILERQLQGRYGLMQSSGTNEFLIAGLEGPQNVEITLDTKTCLPKVLKKYSIDSDRTNGTRNCLMEVRFLWNQPISAGLFIPRAPAVKQ